jgi:UDP-N-acetylmuramate dehydrogenase
MVSFEENVSLLPYNTFGIQAHARFFTIVKTVADMQGLIRADVFSDKQLLILGGGSNLLFTKDFDGVVVKNEIRGLRIIEEDADRVVIEVGSGELWHDLVMRCVENGWGGVENLSLIPGTVGAAPMQNIGAYGVEVKKNISLVSAVNLATGAIEFFDNAACQFGYRESIFKHELKGKYFISSITLILTKRDHVFNTSYGIIGEVLKKNGVDRPTLKAISDAVISIRQSKLPDPKVIGNAGSFFKNPTVPPDKLESLKKTYMQIPSFSEENGWYKIPAAWLIEQSGWKGKRLENIGVHEHQALVLVNYGGGEGGSLWQLAMNIQASVREKFDIILQPEVNVI